jgi:fibronectin-binding autotransporter adhesin
MPRFRISLRLFRFTICSRRLSLVALRVVLVLLGPTLLGDDFAAAQVWTSTGGSASNSFNDGLNWNNGQVPNSTTAVASFTGATAGIAQTVDLANSVTLNQLNFSTTSYAFSTANGSGITLTGSNAALSFTGSTVVLNQNLSAIALTFGSANGKLNFVTPTANVAPTLTLGTVVVSSGASLVITRTHTAANNRVANITQLGVFTAGGDVAIQQLGTGGITTGSGFLNVRLGTFTGVGNLTITGGGGATSVTIGSYAGSGNLNVYNATTAVTLSDFSGGGNLNVFGGTVTATGSGFVGNGDLNISGGTVVINGAFAGSGNISLTGGSLQFNPAAALNVSKNIAILASAGGGVDIRNNSAALANAVVINGNVSNNAGGPGLRTITLAGQNGGNNFLNSTLTDGAVGNTLGIVRDGSTSGSTTGGLWLLGGTNSFSGGITINAAVLGFSAAGNLGNAANVVTLGSYVTNTAAALTLSDASAPVVLANTFRLTGTDSQGAILRNNSATSNTLLVNSSASFAVTSTAGRLLSLGGTNTGLNEVAAVLANDVSGTTLGLAKIEAGTWVVSGNNTFSGQSTLAAGTLVVTRTTALGTAPWTAAGGTLRAGSNPLSLANAWTLLGTLTLSGETSLTLGASNIVVSTANRTIDNENVTTTHYLSGGTIFLGEGATARDLTLTGPAGSTLQINSNITSGTGGTGGSVQFAGAGTFIVNGANSYSGTTSLSGGIVTVGNNLAFGSSTVNVTGGTLQTAASAVSLANNLRLNGNLTLSGAATLTLGGTLTTFTNRTLTANNTAGVVLNNIVLNTSASFGALTIAGNGPVTILGTITEATSTTGGVVVANTSSAGVTFKNVPAYTGTSTVQAGSRLNLDISSDYTLNRVISGGGDVAFNPTTAVTATLGGVNLYSGTTSVVSGTLTFGGVDRLAASSLAVSSGAVVDLNGLAQTFVGLSGTGTLRNGAAATTATVTITGGGTYSGSVLDGAGTLALQKNGPATLTLNGTRSYSGGTTILGGTLVAGSALPGSGNVTLNGGVLGLNGSQILNVGTGANQVRWTSTGGFAAVGGDLTLRFETDGNLSTADALIWGTTVQTGTFLINTQAFVLGSTVGDGRLQIVSSFNLSNNAGQVREFLVLDNPDSANDYAVISGSLFGTTQFKKSGNGLLILSGGNTFSSTSQITGGTLQIGEGATTGSLVATTVTNNAVLLFNRSDNIGYGAGIISGTGAVGQVGSGRLTFTSNNTYSGVTTIGSGSTLQLGNGGAAGAISNASSVANAGTLVFNRNNAYQYDGAISGVGGVVQAGTGTTILGGNNAYTGATSVAAGTLVVTGTLGNTPVTVASAAALQIGGGTLGGAVDILAGGSAALSGTVVGTLSNSGSLQVVAAGAVGSVSLGGLILNGGSLNFDLAGILSSDRVLLTGGTAPTVNAATTLSFNNLGVSQGTYQLIAGYGSNTLGGADFSRLILGQTTLGGFNLTLANHAGSLDLIVSSPLANLVWTGAATNAWNTSDANWTGDASTYSDNSNVLFNNTTSSTAVAIDAGGVAPASLVVNNDALHTYTFSGGAIGGATGLAKQGAGVLVLTGDNTFTGNVNVSGGGTLRLGNGGSTGSITPTLNIALDNASTLVVDRAGTISLSGNVSGSGNLEKRGTGTLSLFGTSNYTGNTTVAGGTLRVAGNGQLANTVGGLYNLIGGTLAIDGAVAQSLPIVTVSNGGTLAVNTALLTTATLNVGGGTVNLNNAVSVGSWSLTSGTVNVNVNTALASLTTFGGGGAGSQVFVRIAGGATLTLANNLTFDATGNPFGAVLAGPGLLSLGVSTARSIAVADSSAADDDLTISASLSASSGFIKTGLGTLYLSGANQGAVTNTLTAGTLKIGNTAALGTGQLNITGTSLITSTSGSVLSADGSARTITNNIGLLGSFAFSGTQNLNLTGTITQSAGARTIAFNNAGGSTISISNLVLSETALVGRTITLAGTGNASIAQISDTAGASSFGSVIVNGGGLTLNLANANNYGGATSIVDGTVVVGDAASLGTGSSAVTIGRQGTVQANPAVFTSGAVTFTRSFNVLLNTNAASTVAFGGATAQASSFTGPITFSSGLRLSAVTGGTVTFGNLTGVGSAGITKVGGGTVVLAGTGSYTGATSIAAGTLVVTGNLGNTPVAVAAGATLAGTGSLGGAVTSSGTIAPGTSSGPGTLTLASLVLSGGTLQFRLDSVAASDRLVFTGAAAPDVLAATSFSYTPLLNFGAGTYHLFTGYTGLLTSTAFGLLSSPGSLNGYNLSLANNAGSLDLVVSLSGGGNGTITTTYSSPLAVTGGTTTVTSGGVTTGSVAISGGTLLVANGGSVGSTAGITVSGGVLNVQSGGTIAGNGTINVGGTGVLNVSGSAGSGAVVINVNPGGTLQGGHYDAATPANSTTGTIHGSVVVQAGGTFDVGNSIGSLTIDGSNALNNTALTLNAGANVHFEFRDVGAGPGVGWDFVDLGASKLVIAADNQDPANQIKIYIDSWLPNNLGHGANNFDPSAATGWTGMTTYDWLFLRVDQQNIEINNPHLGSIGGRFLVIDDADGQGVFGTNNPYTRPSNQYGKGTFKVIAGDFGSGYGLYVHYSAIPEPGSVILAGLASLGAGWYGRRRKRQATAAAEVGSTTTGDTASK